MTSQDQQTSYSDTWILFESGSAVAVNLDFYPPPKETNRPIDAYVVTESAGNFTRSARRAAEAVYGILRQRCPDMQAGVVGYDLHGFSNSNTGDSGGLAFAIALAKRLLKQDPGPVAATGEIVSGHDGGQVGPIKGITAKLEAAGKLTPSGGWILYPKANGKEVPEQLQKTLAAKGVQLHPVASVAEALALLFGWDTPAAVEPPVEPQGKSGSTWTWPAALVLIALTIFFGFKYLRDSGNETPPPAPVVIQPDNPATVQESPELAASIAPEPLVTTPAGPALTINFSGNTSLATELAQTLTSNLRDSLDNNEVGQTGTILSGRVVIKRIIEETLAGQDKVSAILTVSLEDLVIANGDGIPKNFPVIQEEIQGKGQVETLLNQTAVVLSEEVLKIIFSRKTGRDTGFE